MTLHTVSQPISITIQNTDADELPNVGDLHIHDSSSEISVSDSGLGGSQTTSATSEHYMPGASNAGDSVAKDLNGDSSCVEGEKTEADISENETQSHTGCDFEGDDDVLDPDDWFDAEAFEYDLDGYLVEKNDKLNVAGASRSEAKVALLTPMSPFEAFVATLNPVLIRGLDENERTCFICGDVYEGGAKLEVALELPCGHTFGQACIEHVFGPKDKGGWQRRSCPKCKAPVLVAGDD